MKVLSILKSWIRKVLSSGDARHEAELDDELSFHVESMVRELTEADMSETEARDEANRRFGDMESIKDQCRVAQLGLSDGMEIASIGAVRMIHYATKTLGYGFKATVICCALVGALTLFLLYATGYAGAVVSDFDIKMEVASPDDKYLAYVVDYPSLDGPNQSLFVETPDHSRFILVDDLAEDVDSIHEIVWSPGSEIVVFHTSRWLIAARVPTFEMSRVHLGIMWPRYYPKNGRRSTHGTGGKRRTVTRIDFPEPGAFRYQLENETEPRLVHLPEALPEIPLNPRKHKKS